MGYWFVDGSDRADSWHWVGVAISQAQLIGLHRRPHTPNISQSEIGHRRRLWWCCVYRDRWLALGLHQPLRINLEDCDVGTLTINDVIERTSSSTLSEEDQKLIERSVSLAPVFVELAQWSVHLGSVLQCQYKPVGPEDPSNKAESWEISLTTWYNNLDPTLKLDTMTMLKDTDQIKTFHNHILHVFFQ